MRHRNCESSPVIPCISSIDLPCEPVRSLENCVAFREWEPITTQISVDGWFSLLDVSTNDSAQRRGHDVARGGAPLCTTSLMKNDAFQSKNKVSDFAYEINHCMAILAGLKRLKLWVMTSLGWRLDEVRARPYSLPLLPIEPWNVSSSSCYYSLARLDFGVSGGVRSTRLAVRAYRVCHAVAVARYFVVKGGTKTIFHWKVGNDRSSPFHRSVLTS